MNKSKTGRPRRAVTVRRLTVNHSGPADGARLKALQQAACITSVSEKLPLRRGELRQIHDLTAADSVLLEKLTVPQLLKTFPTYYGTRWLITAFTTARHLYPS